MVHARKDYARIQDPWGKIGDDEPVFLIRAQDALMIPILGAYLKLYTDNQHHDHLISMQIAEHIKTVVSWIQKNPGRTKLADAPKEHCNCPAETVVVAMLPDGTPIGGWTTDAEGNHKPSPVGALKEMLNEQHGKAARE
jgi:hypothetical protein